MTREGLRVELQPGSSAGHYDVLTRLGRGGMGEVFLARDANLGRQVALKVLSPEIVSDPDHLERFKREARHLALLSHPNIVTVFSVEEIEGLCVLAMEYVDGRTLRQIVSPGGLSILRFLEIACALSDAVAAAHDGGVVHGDLKPENVMVSESGRVKVLDFGLAQALPTSPAATDTVTHESVLLGTLPYMSPEQIDGHDVDHRSDIFSLGIILHELLIGERPFSGNTPARIATSILHDDPLPVTSLRHDVPPALEGIIQFCLKKDPAQRFQSATRIRNHLQDLLNAFKAEASVNASARFSLRRLRRQVVSLETRTGLTAVLILLILVNWVETSIETALRTRYGLGNEMGYQLAGAMSWIEQGLSFERHDLTGSIGIYGASVAYFVVPLLLGILTAVRLSLLPGVGPYRTFVSAIAATYLLSIGCYLFFPVPERWAYSDSEAVLLSDLWTTALIDALRPISGLDNCFPSFHVASTVVMALLWFAYRLRFRHAVALLAISVILSTFLLGIHWLPDIATGVALGVLSVRLALKLSWVDSELDALAGPEPAIQR